MTGPPVSRRPFHLLMAREMTSSLTNGGVAESEKRTLASLFRQVDYL